VTTIAITGVGGLIGRRVVAALEGHPEIERIVGLDLQTPPGLTSTKLAFRQMDVRDPAIGEVLHDVDLVLHLAFQMDPIRDEAAMRSVNVDGTRNVVEAAERAGVGRLVYLSTVLAYGAHPDNDFPLQESSPLRGTPDFNYAEHKRDVELWLWSWLEDRPGLRTTVLRSASVLGPGVENFFTRVIEAPRITAVKGHKPPLQFIHIDDLVTAIVHAIDHDVVGVYNVSAEGWISFDEATAIVGRHVIEIPEEVAFSTTERLWRLGLGEQPPGIVRLFMHPWVMTSDAFVETGWKPRYTNRDALAATVAEHAEHVALIGFRAQRRTLRWIGASLLAAVVTLTFAGLRRRRSGRR
jgi:nucleoside-diphosphate-sugar epimerase